MLVQGVDSFSPHFLKVKTMMVAKDHRGRSLLAAAVESGREDVFGSVLFALERVCDEEVWYHTLLFHLYLDPCSVGCGFLWPFVIFGCIRYRKYARSLMASPRDAYQRRQPR